MWALPARAQMDNFYTVTVYEKGAEVVRLYATLLGKQGFRKGACLLSLFPVAPCTRVASGQAGPLQGCVPARARCACCAPLASSPTSA